MPHTEQSLDFDHHMYGKSFAPVFADQIDWKGTLQVAPSAPLLWSFIDEEAILGSILGPGCISYLTSLTGEVPKCRLRDDNSKTRVALLQAPTPVSCWQVVDPC